MRVAVQAMAAVLGGTQSLHTNGRDEALALPTEGAARIALRTQQIIGFESGVANTIDPFAGSYHIEQLTTAIEDGARELLTRIESVGGTLAAIEAGYIQRQGRSRPTRRHCNRLGRKPWWWLIDYVTTRRRRRVFQ